jgi:hypothetical protein
MQRQNSIQKIQSVGRLAIYLAPAVFALPLILALIGYFVMDTWFDLADVITGSAALALFPIAFGVACLIAAWMIEENART